jgi:ribosomal protein S18 acetylase RimI-like enzyme
VESARPAGAGDAERITELCVQAREELAAERGAQILLHRELRPDEGDGRRMWVGTFDDVVVGYLTAELEPLADGTTLGRIVEIYVEPRARAVGVGEAMIDLALAWFTDQDCRGVDAYALPGMRETKNFFETFGFTARLLVVHHELGG